MAEAGEKAAKQLREITECPICMNAFTDPRMLPCIHTFCFECLKRTGETAQKSPGDKMSCPLCRKEFIIPKDAMHGVQKNFFMENLLQYKTTLQMGSVATICDICNASADGKTGQVSKATMKCLECQDNYCDSCVKVHQFQKLSRSHQLVKIGSDTKSGTERVSSAKYCIKHRHRPLDFYCAECQKIVCVSCFVESHKSHDCKDVATVDEEFRQTIEEKARKMLAYADEMLLMRNNTEKRHTVFLKEIVEKEKDIHKRSQELKHIIERHTKSLLDELSVIKSNHLKEMAIEMEEIDRSCIILTSFVAYCTELRSKGSASDICSSFDQLIGRADDLEKDHEEYIDRPHQSVEVSFQATDLGNVSQKSNYNLVGQIKDSAKALLNEIKDQFTDADDSEEDNGGKKWYNFRKAKPKQHCKYRKSEVLLESAAVKEAISKLIANQERQLKLVEKQCSVEIYIDKTPGRQNIRLYSEDGDINKATAEIYQILLGMVTKERNPKELELYAKQAVWHYYEGGTFKKYGTYATGIIEKEHHHRKPTAEYTDSKNVKHKINFKDMTDDRSQGGKVPIKRIIRDGMPLPTRWKQMAPDQNSVAVKLNPTEEEYKKVATRLKATDQNNVQSIIQIERIQNPVLYRQFMNRKFDMDRTNPGQENEKQLWHGTNGTNVVNINNRNFNRSYCGQYGAAIGNGVYFATNASYSVSGYCPADGCGHKHIYQARVLTGKCCQGRSGLKEAPPLPNRTDVTYDSVVDNTTSPGVYVVFLDYQTYPEYHITFT